MPGEIAEAFVLIRPLSTGFKQQVEGESKSAALGAAKVFAAAFAGVKIFDFAKDAVKEAAQVQKSTEGIRDGFGGAADGVIEFSHTAAQQFGISTADSQKFSASLAITAKNLGLSKAQAAEMAVGLQRVAGSVGNIRGLDPAQFFDKLGLAMLGNTRGLKQLGIAADSTRIQQAALDAGIVKATVNQAEVTKATEAYRSAVADAQDAVAKYGKGSDEAASAQNKAALAQQKVQKALDGTVPKLDAAQKAQAIYALATKDLDEKQQQAAKHSGDLANEQQKLTAEWSNAKEQIGSALLPAVTSLAGELLGLFDVVRRNEGGIKQAFGTAAEIISPVTFAVRELHDQSQITVPIIAGLAGAFATYKVASFAAKEATALYNAALGAYRISAALAAGQTDVLTSAQVRQAVAEGDTVALLQARAAVQAEAALAIEAEALVTEQLVGVMALYDAAMAGSIDVQVASTLAMEGLAAASINLAAGEEAATAATVGLDAALASNPFGLLALGVSAVVGGLIGYKLLAGESESATDEMASAFRDARDASHDLSDALRGLATGHLDLKQAQLDRARGADQLARDQRTLNQLTDAGKKGTDEYRAAVQAVKQDQISLGRTDLEISRSRGEIADQTEKAREATQRYRGALHEQGQAARDAAEATFRQTHTVTGLVSAEERAAIQTEIAADAAEIYADSTRRSADATSRYADSLVKSNPEAAHQQRLLAAQALAASDLATQLGRVPTQREINVFYKNNMAGLIEQARHLHSEIAGIPSLKTVTIEFAQGHGVPVTRASGGGIEAGQVAITGEGGGGAGAEVSVASTGRQIISHSESVGLFRELAQAVNRLADKIDGGAAPTHTGPLVENLTVTEAGDARRTAQKVVDALALAVPR